MTRKRLTDVIHEHEQHAAASSPADAPITVAPAAVVAVGSDQVGVLVTDEPIAVEPAAAAADTVIVQPVPVAAASRVTELHQQLTQRMAASGHAPRSDLTHRTDEYAARFQAAVQTMIDEAAADARTLVDSVHLEIDSILASARTSAGEIIEEAKHQADAIRLQAEQDSAALSNLKTQHAINILTALDAMLTKAQNINDPVALQAAISSISTFVVNLAEER